MTMLLHERYPNLRDPLQPEEGNCAVVSEDYLCLLAIAELRDDCSMQDAIEIANLVMEENPEWRHPRNPNLFALIPDYLLMFLDACADRVDELPPDPNT
ncbi:MAG: hypothetical protein N4A70_08030 [Pelagimonas sp.]|jgi:hypothetical protein|nr:hypothetical protein [Pelagimonas sp.]